MQTDSYWMSLLWGRIGAAVLVMVALALGAYGIDFSEDIQSQVYGIISSLIAGIGALLAVISKLKEQKRAKSEQSNQSGSAALGALALLLALVLAGGFAAGCANQQSATQQLMEQTNDPGTIALGTYADALEAYITAQELYLPYQVYVRQSRPELDRKVIGHFKTARAVLNDWKTLGAVADMDKQEFREALRKISIETALLLEQKKGVK